MTFNKPINDSNILVVGVARNCEKTLKQDVFRLREAFSSARSIHHYVVESDSVDGTVEVLESLAAELVEFDYVAHGTLREKIIQRTARLAYCRNDYVSYARMFSSKQLVDYIVVADLDGINSHISRTAVESCWNRDDWGACFANQRGPYYDVWALRHQFWSPNDCWEQERFYRQFLGTKVASAYVSVYSRQLCIPEDSEWIEVDSAYGGLGIYCADVFLSPGEHVGLDSLGREICDIPPFHEDIKLPGVKFFINPKLINGTVNEHTRRLSFPRAIKLGFKVAVNIVRQSLSRN